MFIRNTHQITAKELEKKMTYNILGGILQFEQLKNEELGFSDENLLRIIG
jgi:flagellar assembly factor FliW